MSKTDDITKTAAPKGNGENAGAIGEVYDRVSEKVTTAYSAARDKAGGAAETVSTGLETNPLAALLGGIALGAIAGALIPRLAKEKELLAPLGERVGAAASAALEAGKSAGLDALDTNGLTVDGLRGQVNKLVEQALQAAGAAGTAAVAAAKEAAAK